MCGLVSLFAYHPDVTVDSRELMAIRDYMIDRGPDGCGLWLSEDCRVGLGHRRLAIIDTSDDGLQPMSSLDGSIHIVFNGEIYNYQALRKQLIDKGHIFRSLSDTEVLLAGWKEWGEVVVRHLRGMFAFVLWDDVRQTLFIARDPFGIKPLYVSDDGKVLRFASQVKALMAGGAIDKKPDPAGHVSYFLWGSVSEPHTLFEAVKAFPPGEAWLINKENSRSRSKFSSVSELIESAEEMGKSWSGGEVRERLREAVLDSVKAHLIADVPVGIFLSSGIDSCSLAALASEVSGGELHSLTLGFNEYKGLEMDEVPLAEIMGRSLNSYHQTFWVERDDFESDYAAFMKAMDQPSMDGLNTWFVSKIAAKSGLKVAVSGLGGDEFLGGYPSFRQIPALVNKLKYFHSVRNNLGKSLRKIMSDWMAGVSSVKYAGIFEYGTTEPGAYLLRRGVFMPWELLLYLPAEMVMDGLPQVLDELNDSSILRGVTNKSRISALESCLYMRNQLLRDSDWASMAHSIELRVPLVDIKVLASSAYASKADLAYAPKRALPNAIMNRPKTGFSTPVKGWLEQLGMTGQERGLRGWVAHVYQEQTA